MGILGISKLRLPRNDGDEPVVTRHRVSTDIHEDAARESHLDEKQQGVPVAETEAGVTSIEATQTIWGKSGRWLVIAG